MNEQLTVKNFGPIKDATVDFKRVTVFIGPTGGGKSTLAKLAAVFMNNDFIDAHPKERRPYFNDYSIANYMKASTSIQWNDDKITFLMGSEFGKNSISESGNTKIMNEDFLHSLKKDNIFIQLLEDYSQAKSSKENEKINNSATKLATLLVKYMTKERKKKGIYVPTERIFIPSVESSWPGFLRDDIGLPKLILNFANSFLVAKASMNKLSIPFLDIKYLHRGGQDFIKISDSRKLIRLYETASGIQSVTPMLVTLEYFSRQKEQVQSFIIEEPELNLYPTAQQGLMNWLIEKCTKGENDLTITTHSPYILSHLNLLLFAHQVAENHPDRADDVAKVVPRESWINPKEFACYHVEGQKENGVHSIVNPETGLISYNDLDTLAGNSATEFDQLLDINAGLEVE